MLDLDDDALALLRAARGGDDPSPEQRAHALATFRAARAAEMQEHAAQMHEGERRRAARDAQMHERGLGERGLEESRRAVLRLPLRRRWSLTWAAAALVSFVSVGAFADWRAVVEQVRDWSEWPMRVFGARSEQAQQVGLGEHKHAPPRKTALGLNPQPEVPSTSFDAPLLLNPAPVAPAPVAPAPVAPAPVAPAPVAPAPVTSVPKALAPTALVPVAPALIAPVPAERASDARDSARGSAHGSARRAPQKPVAAGTLEAELELIARARDALAGAHYEQALSATREHARLFATGAFVQERRAIEALTQCRAGAGHDLGSAFVRRWPDSLFTPRIIRDCGLSNSVPSAVGPDTDLGSDDSALRKELTP